MTTIYYRDFNGWCTNGFNNFNGNEVECLNDLATLIALFSVAAAMFWHSWKPIIAGALSLITLSIMHHNDTLNCYVVPSILDPIGKFQSYPAVMGIRPKYVSHKPTRNEWKELRRDAFTTDPNNPQVKNFNRIVLQNQIRPRPKRDYVERLRVAGEHVGTRRARKQIGPYYA